MEALGAKGFTLDKDEDINLIVKKALNEKWPTIVVCDIPIDAKALPMIPPGKTIDDIITD
jgi:acetolactate synthase-1/2/3 large subunit